MERYDWFAADVYITHVPTGATRVYETWETHPDKDGFGSVEFSWGKHNNSCDCNRALYFARAGDEEEPDVECGEGRYKVAKIVNVERNEIVYRED